MYYANDYAVIDQIGKSAEKRDHSFSPIYVQVFDVGSRDPNEGFRVSDGLLDDSLVYQSIGDNFGRHA